MDMSWVKQALPTIATALGGPIAGLAAAFIGDKLGLPEQTVESVKAAITGASPADLIRLKEIDTEFQKYLAGLEIDLVKLDNADRDSARAREMSVRDNTPRNIAYAVTIGFFGILVYILTHGFPENNKEVLIYMLGSLSTAWTGIMAYYYGSTKGSSDKTKALTDSLVSSTVQK